jgi:hypothetical protein
MFASLNVFCLEPQTPGVTPQTSGTIVVLKENTIPRTASNTYIPHNVDVLGCLEGEAKCCFVMQRILSSATVIADVCAVGITTGSVTQISSNPKLATALGICGVVCSGLSTVVNLFLMKINSKLIKLDQAIETQRRESNV